MTSSEQALPHSYYVRILRNKLPPGAFAASPRKLWAVAAHLVVIAASYLGIRHSPFVALSAVLSLIIGHSLACIAFLSHELSHKAIVRHRSLRYPLEVFLWGVNLMPATLWQRIHNHSHHVYGNTIHDPDRYYLKSEMEPPDGRVVRWYALLFLPHRHTPIWNPLVWLHFLTYIA